MITRRKSALVIAAAALLLVLGGCSSSPSSESPNTASMNGLDGSKIAFLTVSQSCDYCARQADSFVSAMEDAGADVTMSVNEFDAAEQAQQVTQAISTSPDLMVIWPSDTTSIIPSLERIKQAGIPVVVTTYLPETDDSSLWTAWIGPDDYQLGVQSAQGMVAGLEAAAIPAEGSIVVVTGTPGAASTIGRTDGFTDTIADIAPGLTIAGSQPGNWDQTQATTAAAQLFSQYANDNIVGLFGNSDGMVAGAIVAAERAGFAPGVDLVVTGSDCDAAGYASVKAGKEFATNLQDPLIDAQALIDLVTAVAGGEAVDSINYIPTPPVTAENIADCESNAGI
ncbi:sugar ABC transporter substrate-binding protein [Herbiconiux sp. YIM B11900]|uniref:sugar ABC transporter substrate-binding protein n=1 Tax=Herbiconiux sp. YIM B11900 TaxID=3404131 RepID=UPI003F874292